MRHREAIEQRICANKESYITIQQNVKHRRNAKKLTKTKYQNDRKLEIPYCTAEQFTKNLINISYHIFNDFECNEKVC